MSRFRIVRFGSRGRNPRKSKANAAKGKRGTIRPLSPFELVLHESVTGRKPRPILEIALSILKSPHEIDQFIHEYERNMTALGLESPLQSHHELSDLCTRVLGHSNERSRVFHLWRQVLEKRDSHHSRVQKDMKKK